MKQLLFGGVLGVAGSALVAGIIAYSGVIDVGADAPHSPFMHDVIVLLRERSIERHSRDVVVPPDIDSIDRQQRGSGNYEAMCAGCHLRPGEQDSEIRTGMYPQPPNLASNGDATRPGESARRFWIIKHGIMASGMPAWSKGGMDDEDIWNLVAFMKQLPSLDRQQYGAMLTRSPGHTHAGVPGGNIGQEGGDPHREDMRHHHGDHKH